MPIVLLGLAAVGLVLVVGLAHGAAVSPARLELDTKVDANMPAADRDALWNDWTTSPPAQQSSNPDWWDLRAASYTRLGWPKAAALCTERAGIMRALLAGGL